jgi:spore cortex biosynthesis protein YabQ
MGITLEMQLEFFIWSLISGLFSGLSYDFFRLARKMTNPKIGTIIIHDILFLALAAVSIFAVSLTVGRGYLRFFEFFGVFCGFALYRLAFGDSVVNILTAIIRFLIKTTILIAKIVFFPFIIVYKILRKPVNIIIWRTKRTAKKTGSAFKIRRERLLRGVKNSIFAARKK